MSGIKEILVLHFWVNSENKRPLEALLADRKALPKDRIAILRELEEEHLREKPGLSIPPA
ncbi:MAG TPA: hypothetical protein PKA00_00250 [Saprospiraceae bacterium]|nr:hypothetical protein [Saprospiraceae bacterium]HMQ81294.1 hypothetical protein [Saprospiraceae bacterium]